MAINIIPKKEKGLSTWQAALFIIIIAFIAIIVFSILFFLLSWQAARGVEEKETLIREIREDEETKRLEEEIGGLYVKATQLQTVLNSKKITLPGEEEPQRKKALAVFAAMEDASHPEVSFFDFEVDFNEKEINAQGIAKDLIAFDQQERILRAKDFVEYLDMLDFSKEEDEEEIRFEMHVVFSEDLFKIKNIEERAQVYTPQEEELPED